jgi:uncharacterized BrkB/YihY/UPF0761 family membrane protein
MAIMAAAIAYLALFSLFPLILLSIFIARFTLGPLMDQQFIVQKLELLHQAWASYWAKILTKSSKHVDQSPGSLWLV